MQHQSLFLCVGQGACCAATKAGPRHWQPPLLHWSAAKIQPNAQVRHRGRSRLLLLTLIQLSCHAATPLATCRRGIAGLHLDSHGARDTQRAHDPRHPAGAQNQGVGHCIGLRRAGSVLVAVRSCAQQADRASERQRCVSHFILPVLFTPFPAGTCACTPTLET